MKKLEKDNESSLEKRVDSSNRLEAQKTEKIDSLHMPMGQLINDFKEKGYKNSLDALVDIYYIGSGMLAFSAINAPEDLYLAIPAPIVAAYLRIDKNEKRKEIAKSITGAFCLSIAAYTSAKFNEANFHIEPNALPLAAGIYYTLSKSTYEKLASLSVLAVSSAQPLIYIFNEAGDTADKVVNFLIKPVMFKAGAIGGYIHSYVKNSRQKYKEMIKGYKKQEPQKIGKPKILEHDRLEKVIHAHDAKEKLKTLFNDGKGYVYLTDIVEKNKPKNRFGDILRALPYIAGIGLAGLAYEISLHGAPNDNVVRFIVPSSAGFYHASTENKNRKIAAAATLGTYLALNYIMNKMRDAEVAGNTVEKDRALHNVICRVA